MGGPWKHRQRFRRDPQRSTRAYTTLSLHCFDCTCVSNTPHTFHHSHRPAVEPLRFGSSYLCLFQPVTIDFFGLGGLLEAQLVWWPHAVTECVVTLAAVAAAVLSQLNWGRRHPPPSPPPRPPQPHRSAPPRPLIFVRGHLCHYSARRDRGCNFRRDDGEA